MTCKMNVLGTRWTVCGADSDGPCMCGVVVRALPTDDAPAIHVPCPLGCGRLVSADRDEIHYCVIRPSYKVPATREYVATWDGAFLACGDNHHDVQVQVDEYRIGLFADGLIDAPPAAIYARPAEPGLDILVGPPEPLDLPAAPSPSSDAPPPSPASPSSDSGRQPSYPCPCLATTARTEAPTPRAATLAATDPLAQAIAADPNAAPLLSACRRCGAPSPTWLCAECAPTPDPSADLRTMEMLMRATLEAWKCLDVPTPYDDELAALARQVERLSAAPIVCRECGGAHQAAVCPRVKAEWRRQSHLEHAGAGVWRHYRSERHRFLGTLERTSATDTYAMAEALAYYLTSTNEMRVEVTADRVLRCWSKELATYNEAAA